MKRLFIALLFLGFLSANAQSDKKTSRETPINNSITPDMAAKNDLDALTKFIPLNKSRSASALHLFTWKQQSINGAATAEEKAKISNAIDKRFEVLLGAETYTKFKGNTELYNRLIK